MTERREFQMDKNLLVDVIKRQAGSLQKAVLEGVMNSIEAGATAKTGGVQVTLDAKQLIISDGGRGFRNRQEIEDWFETFGKPHEESEGKKWAQFRMGRGQLMAFGRNLWNSNKFQMDVDIDNKGLGYDLSEVKPVKGCRVQVDLYNPLDDSEIWSTSREIERAVKYVEIPVFVNGKQVNTPASEAKWDKTSTDEAFFKLAGKSAVCRPRQVPAARKVRLTSTRHEASCWRGVRPGLSGGMDAGRKRTRMYLQRVLDGHPGSKARSQ